jgi:hypothetical protein
MQALSSTFDRSIKTCWFQGFLPRGLRDVPEGPREAQGGPSGSPGGGAPGPPWPTPLGTPPRRAPSTGLVRGPPLLGFRDWGCVASFDPTTRLPAGWALVLGWRQNMAVPRGRVCHFAAVPFVGVWSHHLLLLRLLGVGGAPMPAVRASYLGLLLASCQVMNGPVGPTASCRLHTLRYTLARCVRGWGKPQTKNVARAQKHKNQYLFSRALQATEMATKRPQSRAEHQNDSSWTATGAGFGREAAG